MTDNWRFIRSLFAVPMHAAAPATTWSVLAYDVRADQCGGASAEWQHDISVFRRNTWSTIWCDGAAVRRFESPIVRRGANLCALETNVISRTKAHRCAEGQLCSRYTVEMLQAVPVTGGKSQMLWQSPESRFLDFCRCRSIAEGEKLRVDVEESSAFSIQAILDDNISIDSLTDEYNIASNNPHGGRSWHTMRFTRAGLRRRRLPRTLIERADAVYTDLAQHNETVHDYHPAYMDTDGFLLMPGKEGMAVEFQCDYRLDPFDASLYRLRLDHADGFSDGAKQERIAFRQEHMDLLDWDEVELFTVSPDRCAVVFVKDGELIWTAVSGRSIALGPISRCGGWQWVNTAQLAPADRAWLAAEQQALAC